MLRGSKLVFGCITCLLSIGLAACMFQKPVREDLVGLWVERQKASNAGDTATYASFRLFADGRFEAHGIPREYFTFPGPRISNVSGSWWLEASSKDPFDFPRVMLRFDRSEDCYAFESQLLISTDGREYILFAWYGDMSDRITFVKRDNAVK